eukprot:3382197-Karenia_brevis.AAC.1
MTRLYPERESSDSNICALKLLYPLASRKCAKIQRSELHRPQSTGLLVVSDGPSSLSLSLSLPSPSSGNCCNGLRLTKP